MIKPKNKKPKLKCKPSARSIGSWNPLNCSLDEMKLNKTVHEELKCFLVRAGTNIKSCKLVSAKVNVVKFIRLISYLIENDELSVTKGRKLTRSAKSLLSRLTHVIRSSK